MASNDVTSFAKVLVDISEVHTFPGGDVGGLPDLLLFGALGFVGEVSNELWLASGCALG